MEELTRYLVLTGALSPAEGILFQHILTSSLSKRKVRSLLQNLGFKYDDVIPSMQTKELVKINKNVTANWEGIKKLIEGIEEKLRRISHDLIQCRELYDQKSQGQGVKPTIITRTPEQPLTPERLLLQFAGNQNARSASKLLERANTFNGVEMLERLAELNVLKIIMKKQSRTIKLRSDGAALRYLFQNKTNLNSANLTFLEETFLVPQKSTWKKFLETLNSESDVTLPSWIINLLVLFLNLGVIVKKSDDSNYELITPSTPPPFGDSYLDELILNVSGFIPVYVNRLHEVLAQLNVDNNSKNFGDKIKLGPSSISGILKMLTKFQLITKSKKAHCYQLTELGTDLLSGDEEAFAKGLRRRLKKILIFSEVLKFAQSLDQFGYMDLVGYFRASGVSNFNHAKALAVLRLMTQTNYSLQQVEKKSGIFELKEGIPR